MPGPGEHDAMAASSSTETALLVPGLAAGSSVTAVRSLGRAGYQPIVVTTDPSIPVCRSKYCGEVYEVPAPSEDVDGYRDGLLTLAARQDVSTVVPLQEADSYVLARDRDRFAEEISTPWPTFDTVRRVQDWLRLRDAAAAADVAVPRTATLDEWTEWNQPLVVKGRYSIIETDGRLFSPGVEFFREGSRPDVDSLVSSMKHVPIVQSFIPGGEYGYFALFDQGEPVTSFQHRRVRSYTYSGGASVYRRSVWDPALEAAGERLLRELDWHGPAMVEFKRDARDGSFVLIEINPRFWGSLALPVHAGVDFPRLYAALASERDVDPPSGYTVGMGSHLVRGECSYLHSVLRYEYPHLEPPSLAAACWAVGSSVLLDPQFDLLSMDDPRPFVADIGRGVRAAGQVVRSAIGSSG